jgi:hypothetical protein
MAEDRLKEYQEMVKADLKVDYVKLDDASIDTPKLYGKYLTMLTDEVIRLSELDSMAKKVYKARWSYFMGHAPEEVYKKDPLRVKINKLEINKYMDADDVMSEMSLRLDRQKAIVKLLEETIKAINSRQYAIKDAISWRIFQSGGMR